jgi:phosphoenolpyruvate carboxykinase (ATP)
MGAALITKRNRAENVKEEDLDKLVFEPFANPFRVYELYKDVEAFFKVIETGAECYTFNSSVYWRASEEDVEDIKLKDSLTLQTAILMDQLEWKTWEKLPGAMVPTADSLEKILPGFYQKYDPAFRQNMNNYIALLKNRFEQRRKFLINSDLQTKPELLEKLVNSLEIIV